jgi:hypothetical protein
MKPFKDFWRGDGHYTRWKLRHHTLVLAIRKKWYFYTIKPPAKPGYRRFYCGPFELEISKR